jgi:hypothetical protein
MINAHMYAVDETAVGGHHPQSILL